MWERLDHVSVASKPELEKEPTKNNDKDFNSEKGPQKTAPTSKESMHRSHKSRG